MSTNYVVGFRRISTDDELIYVECEEIQITHRDGEPCDPHITIAANPNDTIFVELGPDAIKCIVDEYNRNCNDDE